MMHLWALKGNANTQDESFAYDVNISEQTTCHGFTMLE